jgi:hypothetical protein
MESLLIYHTLDLASAGWITLQRTSHFSKQKQQIHRETECHGKRHLPNFSRFGFLIRFYEGL